MSWFLEYAEILGIKTEGVSVLWTPPRREMIDPTKEVPALKSAVRSGFITLQDAMIQNGYEPEVMINQISDMNEKLDGLGIILDTDPRQSAGGGN